MKISDVSPFMRYFLDLLGDARDDSFMVSLSLNHLSKLESIVLALQTGKLPQQERHKLFNSLLNYQINCETKALAHKAVNIILKCLNVTYDIDVARFRNWILMVPVQLNRLKAGHLDFTIDLLVLITNLFKFGVSFIVNDPALVSSLLDGLTEMILVEGCFQHYPNHIQRAYVECLSYLPMVWSTEFVRLISYQCIRQDCLYDLVQYVVDIMSERQSREFCLPQEIWSSFLTTVFIGYSNQTISKQQIPWTPERKMWMDLMCRRLEFKQASQIFAYLLVTFSSND
jgi:hypothetical protein